MGKTYPIVGACGLDCILCPRYYTEGKSKCDGCGSAYSYAAVGCKFFRCCVKERKFETCAECNEAPCSKFKGADDCDSFLTHRKMMPNLKFIREHGLKVFLTHQKKQHNLLETLLRQYNDGRSRTLYCTAATLLSLKALTKVLSQAEKKVKAKGIKDSDFKSKAKILKEVLNTTASKEKTNLTLRKPPNSKKQEK